MAGKYIELRQHRDFGEVLNATFEFITGNFGNFFKVIFTIVGPLFVLAAASLSFFGYRIFNGFLSNNFFNNRFYYYDDNLFGIDNIILIAVTVILVLAAFLLL